MNIILFGASGYLGSNIAYSMAKNGYNVFCVVRECSDTSILKNMHVRFVKNELNNLEKVFEKEKIDWVINAMCVYKPNKSLYGDMFEANLTYPLNILNLGIKYGIKNYISIGTSLPDELNMYSFTKHHLSDFGRYLSEVEEINFADIQLEMFYGGLYEPANRFISSCIERLEKNEPLDLTEGIQKRDLIRVEDIVSILERIIKTDYLSSYMVLPMGSGENHSIKEIITYMKEVIGSNSQLRFGAIQSRKNEPDTLADIQWYNDIDYTLKYSYYEGLKEYCIK